MSGGFGPLASAAVNSLAKADAAGSKCVSQSVIVSRPSFVHFSEPIATRRFTSVDTMLSALSPTSATSRKHPIAWFFFGYCCTRLIVTRGIWALSIG